MKRQDCSVKSKSSYLCSFLLSLSTRTSRSTPPPRSTSAVLNPLTPLSRYSVRTALLFTLACPTSSPFPAFTPVRISLAPLCILPPFRSVEHSEMAKERFTDIASLNYPHRRDGPRSRLLRISRSTEKSPSNLLARKLSWQNYES